MLNSDFTVLLVEDNLEIAQEMTLFLQRRFRAVWHVPDAEAALKIHERHRPDVAIVDIELPGMDGLSLIEQIRQEDQKMLIYVVTAHMAQSYLLRAVRLGLEEFIPKPVSLLNLQASLNASARKLTDKKRLLCADRGLYYHFRRKQLLLRDRPIGLTHMEITLLEELLKKRDHLLAYDEIQEALYAGSLSFRDPLRSLVYRLRGKLSGVQLSSLPDVGYRLESCSVCRGDRGCLFKGWN
jgi:DNA-binding response OmpR family regulator